MRGTMTVMRSVVVLVALTAAVAAQAATATAAPRLVVVDRAPLTIAGRGFPGHRQLTLFVRSPKTSERRALRSDANGRFRAVIRRVSLTGPLRCGAGVTITVRVKGDGLVLWHQTLPNCPAPLRPPAGQTS